MGSMIEEKIASNSHFKPINEAGHSLPYYLQMASTSNYQILTAYFSENDLSESQPYFIIKNQKQCFQTKNQVFVGYGHNNLNNPIFFAVKNKEKYDIHYNTDTFFKKHKNNCDKLGRTHFL